MILLDTQVILWSSAGDLRLSESSRRQMDEARLRTGLFLSPISAWEIAMLIEKGRLKLTVPTHSWITDVVEGHQLRWAALTTEVAVDAGQLPGDIHGDPADRMIIATARALGCPVLTSDSKILTYAKAGHVRALDARR